MLTQEAIKALAIGQADAIVKANVELTSVQATALPDNFKLVDLEPMQAHRVRARGTMTTSVLDDFSTYVQTHREDGAMVFLDQASMQAIAVLNLGTSDAPGHADNVAVFKAKTTAAYNALHQVAGGRALTQTTLAEFLEDWEHCVECRDTEGEIDHAKAVAAVRRITIEALRKLDSEEKQLSASRTLMDSVKATSTERIPTRITFKCNPYVGLAERDFVMRLGILTSGEKPSITLRIISLEEHQEEMAEELCDRLSEAMPEGGPEVLIGTYQVKA